MTVALVRQAINAFLRTPNPQVLCIRGKWGVGKTFIWEEVFKEARATGSVALPYYCYVSLFGLQSIDEVRQTIFENRVTTKNIEIEPNLESLKENVTHYALEAGKRVSRLSPFAKVPFIDTYIANFSGGFRQIVALAVRDTIICFDDFERKKISAKDLLGLVSQFREQKRCKAVIILNEDALSDDEKGEFRRYFEKVVDIPIEFSPDPTECADIAIKGTDIVSERIRKNTIALGISNIRIIDRIKNVAEDLCRILEPYGDTARYQAIHTLTLFIWSKYDGDAIPMKFIIERGGRDRFLEGFSSDAGKRTDDEKRWDSKLKEYQFDRCDNLDAAIVKGVEKGFFDHDEIAKEAQLQDEREAGAAGEQALRDAWRGFRGSFDDNGPEVVEAVCTAYKQHMKKVSRSNLDQAIAVFRQLDFADKASELISAWVATHKDSIKGIDDTANPFHPIVQDNEFRSAIAAVIKPPQRRPMKDILMDIGRGNLGREDIESALAMSVDDLYEFFKGLKGDEVGLMIECCLSFRRTGNPTEQQREFTARSLRALEKIGGESAINGIRVQKFLSG